MDKTVTFKCNSCGSGMVIRADKTCDIACACGGKMEVCYEEESFIEYLTE
jgi:hypothetical protein